MKRDVVSSFLLALLVLGNIPLVVKWRFGVNDAAVLIERKFEPWLMDKLRQFEFNGTRRYYSLVVRLNMTVLAKTDFCSRNEVASFLAKNCNSTVNYVCSVFPVIILQADVARIRAIAEYDFVEHLGDGEAVGELMLDVSASVVRAREVHERFGLNGTGIKVSVLDSGIDDTHPVFRNKRIIFRDFYNDTGEYVKEPWETGDNSNIVDYTGHGTYCASILAGKDPNNIYNGIACGVDTLIVGQVTAQGYNPSDPYSVQLFENAVIRSLDWAVSKGAQVISISFGFNRHLENPSWYCDGTCEVCQAVNDAVKHCVVVVACAGNTGPAAKTLDCPAVASDVITVGAIDDINTETISDATLWIGSSRGPTEDGRIKPDMLAPGVNIIAADIVGSGGYSSGDWYEGTGTSAAAPHVAGVAALILQAHPYWGPKAVKSAIMATASLNDNLAPLSRNDRGTGIVDALGALTCGLDLSVEAESGETSGYGDYHAVAYLSGRYKIYVQGRPGDAHAVATLKKSFVPDYNLTDPTFFLFPNKG